MREIVRTPGVTRSMLTVTHVLFTSHVQQRLLSERPLPDPALCHFPTHIMEHGDLATL